jgi:virginiamycin B lyase
MKRLSLFCSLILLTLFLVSCSGTTTTLPSSVPTGTPTANMAIGSFQEYPLPQVNSGMMRPAIDREGRIWFGEMSLNRLAVFDPRTRTFQQMTPPRGRSGIMGVEVASDDTIWFAEQYANYIGHYLPSTGQYHIYSLPTLTIPDPSNAGKTLSLPSAPNDLALDSQGDVWFTELNADALGKLDMHTGQVQQYPVSTRRSVQMLDPYGITVDPQGIVWFTEASNNRLGRLDPASGDMRSFTMPGLEARVTLMEIASDPRGIIWATSFTSGLLLSFDPHTSIFTPYYTSPAGNDTGGLYGLAIASSSEVWVTLTEENTIARLDVMTHHFVFYQVPTKGSLPLGVVMGAHHTLWFTEAGSDKIGMLRP